MFQFKCLDRLESLRKQGITILLVSHDIGLIKNNCEKCLYLDQGCLKASGTPNEMAELYFLNNRQRQTGGGAGNKVVKPKKHLGNGDVIAFGTDQGRIFDAGFIKSGLRTVTVSSGEEAAFFVAWSCSSDLKMPALSFDLQDLRGYVISGFRQPLKGPKIMERVQFSFLANLCPGVYSLTVRLEDFRADGLMIPVDKQVGLLQLVVLDGIPRRFLGTVDLNAACKIIQPGKCRGDNACDRGAAGA